MIRMGTAIVQTFWLDPLKNKGFSVSTCLSCESWAYAERFSKRLPVAVDDDRVCCAGCAHFERLDRPHMGRCAAGKGRHWLWDTDRRECKDFEAAGALN